jgi:hypothetical protein
MRTNTAHSTRGDNQCRVEMSTKLSVASAARADSPDAAGVVASVVTVNARSVGTQPVRLADRGRVSNAVRSTNSTVTMKSWCRFDRATRTISRSLLRTYRSICETAQATTNIRCSTHTAMSYSTNGVEADEVASNPIVPYRVTVATRYGQSTIRNSNGLRKKTR